MGAITTDYKGLKEAGKKIEASLKFRQQQLKSINRQLNKKKLSKKTKENLMAKKNKIVDIIKNINAAKALLPAKFSTNNVKAIRGSVKTVKIPGDNVFAVSTAGIPAEAMEKVFFDSIGATEIINLERHDQINTVNAPYQPIADMLAVNDAYNPNKIVSLQKIASMYFNTFAIPFETYEPNNGTGPDNEIVYIENSTGDLIINVVDLPQNFRVEVQVLSFEDILNDTIYI